MNGVFTFSNQQLVLPVSDDLVQDVGVMRLGRGLKDQGRIRRRILRLELPHRLEIAGVGDYLRELLELVELAQAGGGNGFECCGTHKIF